jgi:heme exporter protein B
VLIFAAGIIRRSQLLAGDPTGALLLLCGLDLGLLAITPWATAAALRQAVR